MSDTPRTDKVCSDHALAWFGLTSHLDRAMDEANKLRELARQLERELAAAEAERDALRNQPAPVAWIATNQHGDVLHFSKHDGWTVEVVIEERKT